MTTAHSEAPTLVHEPSGEGLAAELLARRRKRLPAVTLTLALLVVAAAAFIGGIYAQKHWGSSSAPSSNAFSAGLAATGRIGGSGVPAGFPSLGSGRGLPSGFGGGASGTVTLIKGSTLYVTSASGNTVLVHLSASSRVSKSVSGSAKAIHPGDTVTVVGSQGKDGSYTARQVTIGGASG